MWKLERTSHGSMVKVANLHPANLCSTPTGTHMSHWWWQEGHLAKIAPLHQSSKRPILVGMSKPLNKRVNDVKFGHFFYLDISIKCRVI